MHKENPFYISRQPIAGSNPVLPTLCSLYLWYTPPQIDQRYFNGIDQGVTIPLMNGYTLREAAEALGVSIVTIRRYIKSGKLRARLVHSKFGESYVIDDLPLLNKPLSDNTISTQPLINRIEQLSQEVGYWKAKAEFLQERLLLLEAPKQTPTHKWWHRIFKRSQSIDRA
jgi:excisionase family DNA binding protein